MINEGPVLAVSGTNRNHVMEEGIWTFTKKEQQLKHARLRNGLKAEDSIR